jgi:hypothetical protein
MWEPQSMQQPEERSHGVRHEQVRAAASVALERLLPRLHEAEPGSKAFESLVSQTQLLYMAMAMPAASLGTCHCGKDLRYKGTPSGDLFVCCVGATEHCWRIAG